MITRILTAWAERKERVYREHLADVFIQEYIEKYEGSTLETVQKQLDESRILLHALLGKEKEQRKVAQEAIEVKLGIRESTEKVRKETRLLFESYSNRSDLSEEEVIERMGVRHTSHDGAHDPRAKIGFEEYKA